MMKAVSIFSVGFLSTLLLIDLSLANPSIMTLESDTDRPGQDYKNFDLSLPNPDLCLAACEKDQKCLAYTYVKPGFQGPIARCWLKNSIPPSQSPCCDSGIKSNISGPQNGLTAYWSFDAKRRNPTHVFDLSGNNHHGSIQGATFVEGVKGDAASFDGVDDFISILPSAFPSSTDGSLAFWIKLNNGSNGKAFSTSNKDFVCNGFRTYRSKTGELYLSTTHLKCPAVKDNNATVGSKIKYNQWKHVAWTWKYNTKEKFTLIKAYQDGFEMQSKKLSGKVLVPDSAIYIGRRIKYYFNGLVDELRLYDRALSEKEIQGIEKNVLVRFVSSLTFPEENPRLEIKVMNPAILVGNLKMKITAQNNGTITYGPTFFPIKDVNISLTFNQFFNKHDVRVELINNNTGQLISTLATGEIFVEKRKTLHKLVYLSFRTPRISRVWIKDPGFWLPELKKEHIAILEDSPYDALAFRFYGPRANDPKFDPNKVPKRIKEVKNWLKNSSKEFHPWLHLSQIQMPCSNDKGLDLFDQEKMLEKFYIILKKSLQAANEWKSSSIIIDPEYYGGCKPSYEIGAIALKHGISPEDTINELKKIGAEMADKINLIYPKLQYMVFLFTRITSDNDTIRNIVLGMLERAQKKSYKFKIVDGGEGHGFYFSCTFEELKRKSINRFADYYEYLKKYSNFELGGVIRPYYDFQKTSLQKKGKNSCGSSLKVKYMEGQEGHLPLMEYQFSTNKYVWIFAAENAGPYDMFHPRLGNFHRKKYEPTIIKALDKAGRCNLNGICDLGEKKANCFSDCNP